MAQQVEVLRMRTVQRFMLATTALLLGLMFAPAADAQGGGMMNMSPDERAAQRITVLTERVQITPQQGEQLKPILVKQFTEQVALFQKFQGGGDRQAMMGEAGSCGFLTGRLTAVHEDGGARRRNRGGPGGGQ